MELQEIKTAVQMGYDVYFKDVDSRVVFSQGKYAIKDVESGICTELSHITSQGIEMLCGEAKDFFSNPKDAWFILVDKQKNIKPFMLEDFLRHGLVSVRSWLNTAQPGEKKIVDERYIIRINKITWNH